MKQKSISMENVTKKLVKYITEKEMYGWPPLCPALCYQPVRPKMEEDSRINDVQYAKKL